jgi:hypothetical protein
MPLHPNHYALVVGIDHYPKFRSLKGARDDADRFAQWLRNEAAGGGLAAENVKVVLSEEDPARPIQDNIDEALEEILERTGSDKGGRLYIYFSGHGLAYRNVGADLCLAKWSMKRRNLALDSLDYLNLVAGSGNFREIAFFMDCCRVRIPNARGMPTTLGFARPEAEAAESRTFVAYATLFLNAAFEAATAPGSGHDDGIPGYHGHFTRALMAGLSGGAARPAGGVPASALKQYLEAETPRIAAEYGHNQTPEVINGFPSESEPIFGSALPRVNLEIRFRENRTGMMVLEGPNTRVVRQGDAATGPWRLNLGGGLHVLRDAGSGEEKVIRFRPEEGVQHVDF